MPKIAWHVMITSHYSTGFPRCCCLSAMPAPATASLGRLQTQGNGEATAGPNWMGPNVHTVEESGRCQHLSSLGTDFRAVHAVMGESFLRGREYSTAHDRSRNVGGYIPANLEDPPAITGCFVTLRCPGLGVEGASWSSQRETDHHGTLRGSDVGKCPLARLSSGW
jgi:hypothetical protein